MILEASVQGIFKTILLILGTFVLLRFIGQILVAKRNLEEDRRLKAEQEKFDKELKRKQQTFGKTSIISQKTTTTRTKSTDSVEDIDFEEIPNSEVSEPTPNT